MCQLSLMYAHQSNTIKSRCILLIIMIWSSEAYANNDHWTWQTIESVFFFNYIAQLKSTVTFYYPTCYNFSENWLKKNRRYPQKKVTRLPTFRFSTILDHTLCYYSASLL
jgi:hypothetical protein